MKNKHYSERSSLFPVPSPLTQITQYLAALACLPAIQDKGRVRHLAVRRVHDFEVNS